MSGEGDGPSWASRPGVQVVFALLVLLCCSPGLDNFPAGDDYDWVFDSVKMLHNPSHFLTPLNHFLRQTEALYFCVIIAGFGFSAAAFFAASILLHVANFLLVSRLLARTCGDAAFGLAGAVFWALNYKHVEVLYRQYGVADSLALLFGVAALLLLIEKRTVAATLVFVPALFAKENTIVLPVIAAAWIFFFGDRRSILKRVAPMAVLTALFVVAEFKIRTGSSYLVADLDGLARFWDSLLTYVGPDAVSLGQVALGGRMILTPVWLAIVLSLALVAVFFAADRTVKFALLWIAATLAPTVFIVHQTSRYHYVPLVGVALLVAHGLRAVGRRGPSWQRNAAVAYSAVLLVCVVGIQIEESDHEAIGELHRTAHESFTANILPGLPAGDGTLVFFTRGSTMDWAEDLMARNDRPWYQPSTYKWVYRRPYGVAGLANTFGFVTACATRRGEARLFVAASRAEYEAALAKGDFLIVAHDTQRNAFAFASEGMRAEIVARAAAEDLYDYLQPGRFDSTFEGSSRLAAANRQD